VAAASPRTASEILDALDNDTRAVLGLLNTADDTLAELTLSALPFGQRALLATYDLITPAEIEIDNQPRRVSLTPLGREVIALCAAEQLPEDVRQALAALEDARVRRDALASGVDIDLLETKSQ